MDEKATEGPVLGLALSGGGFRAAFFHVGVLARLAELGFLRKVQVISTVSGGSIVGALYYILLKDLLQNTPDGKISDTAYCMLVAEVEAQLRSAVRLNIRARIFSNVLKNVQMAGRGYSRSTRIGDLYDRHIYKPAWPDRREVRAFGRETQIRLSELVISPMDEAGVRQEGFKPDEDNAGRTDKVPMLLINATSLNTGHAWRFEAVRMGEPLPKDPKMRELLADIDKNMRLEQGYFGDPPPQGTKPRPPRQFDSEALQKFPLGVAVAASAGVPGLFQPVTIQGAYSGIDVQLVDGGVYDNQGIQGLFDMSCTHMIISDGSGQMDDVDKPATRIPAVLGRALVIPGDSVRDEQLVRASLPPVEAHALMHLRKGLDGWVVPPGESRASGETEHESSLDRETFRVAPDVQEALSNLRTDLDFFSHVESSSLELDGYRMTAHVIADSDGDWSQVSGTVDVPPQEDALPWRFENVEHLINERDYPPYLRRLKVGAERFFRPMRWPGPARWLLYTLAGALLALLALGFIFADLGDHIADWASVGYDLPAVLYAMIALAGLAWLYTMNGAFSKAVFVFVGWITITLAAVPLALSAWSQLLLQPLLNRLDQIPRGPEKPEVKSE